MSGARLIRLPYRLERELPSFETSDPSATDKFPESLARHFIRQLTGNGDRVFDPFAGLGTTLFVAEELGRRAYGMEADRQRQEWVAGQLDNWQGLISADAATMLDHGFPKMDLVLTSPPYMPRHHRWNPLYGGDPARAGYDAYLDRMAHIFGQLGKLLRRNAYAVVQLDNLRGRVFTPLVRDVGAIVSGVMRLDDEILVQWRNGREDHQYTHCLLFRNTVTKRGG